MKRHVISSMIIAFCVLFGCGSCNNEAGKKFEVKGTLIHGKPEKVYLEVVPMTGAQPVLEDSSAVNKDGKFLLKAKKQDESIFILTTGEKDLPFAYVVNDVPKLSLEVTMDSSGSSSEKFDVKGSAASQQLKDFMNSFTEKLKAIYFNLQRVDSLQKAGAADTLISPLAMQHSQQSQELKKYISDIISRSQSPALIMFVLGNYQSAANSSSFGISPFSNEEMNKTIGDLVARFPSHQGLAAIKKTFDAEAERMSTATWVGKPAPEIALPDVNGKEVKLSSFRGKYVLVDFWASWCRPCRAENPNVVNAFNKFKNKNFTVLGVSLDKPDGKEEWVKAINDDKLTWTHVSDLKYWNSSVVPLYHIEGIPFNVLVDPDGKIIAQELRGSALEAKLQEVLPERTPSDK